MIKLIPDVEKTVRDIRRHTRKLPKRESALSSNAWLKWRWKIVYSKKA